LKEENLFFKKFFYLQENNCGNYDQEQTVVEDTFKNIDFISYSS
jgi:hypothetical protein